MRTTVSLNESNSAYVAQRATADDSNAEGIRKAVDRGRRLEGRERALAADARDTIKEQRDRIDELERELERVKNEKRVILQQREENTELVRYAQRERSKQERLADVGVLRSLKWRLTGVPDSEE